MDFNLNINNKIPQNWVDLSHSHKTSFHMGALYPVAVMETMPGDKWRMSTTKFLRTLPLVSPVMHQFSINEHWFYVPNRIIWDGWEEFITVRQETTVRLIPQISIYDAAYKPATHTWEQIIGVYMGLPNSSTLVTTVVNALPICGYVQIWNNFFRQTQIFGEITCTPIDGVNTVATLPYRYELAPLRVLWRRDYFTAALPSPTLGVTVPLNSLNQYQDVELNQTLTGFNRILDTDRTAVAANVYLGARTADGQRLYQDIAGAPGAVIDPNGQWNVNVGTIEMLRSAFALQAYLEKENRAGGRYKDIIEAHYPVKIPDYRVNIPEYIGSTYQNLVISEVLSQSVDYGSDETPDFTPLGEMAGHGISIKRGGKFEYTTLEHGYMYCLISIVPELVYNNVGLHRMWRREFREDFPMPEFANLGEQAIINEELNANHTDINGTFGYVPRYSEMKYAQNRISGEMASSLDYWHLGQTMPTNVALNSAFLQINQNTYDLDRIFAAGAHSDEEYFDNFVADIYFDIQVKRPLPRYGLPANLTANY